MEKYIAVYDIHSNRSRYRVNKMLGSWGQRVQRSVYEIVIPETEFALLQNKLKKLMGRGDSLRFYSQTATQKPLCLGDNEIKISRSNLVVY